MLLKSYHIYLITNGKHIKIEITVKRFVNAYTNPGRHIE